MSNWDKKIDKAEKFLQKAHEHGKKVYGRYKDERDERSSGQQKVNMFYSNVNTIKESLFNSMPKPEVKRVQRGDFQDDVSRVAADVVRRMLAYEVECAEDFREAIELAIIDRLVPGLGQVWISFEVDHTPASEDDEGDMVGSKPIPGTERLIVEQVYWEDFLYEPCKRWSKCGWVGRRLHLSKSEFEGAYGKEKLEDVAMASGDNSTLVPKELLLDKLCVYEIWDKKSKKVYHIYRGLDEPLKTLDDPYKLRKFFPCPRPLIANVDSTGFLPVTDYHLAQDQYNQLDVIYGRIQLIVEALKVAGLYDAEATDIARMLQGAENRLVPVDNWAMHAEKGGARGMIDWYPVEQVATVLQHLYAAFEATKGLLFEVTGMSDIVRGASNQYETAAAQQIKAQFASVRLNGFQRTVAIFVRDIMRIMAELSTQLYSDEKVLEIIGQLPPEDMQLLPMAAQVLRNDVLSKYKVDIQAGSLTEADWALEKQERMELVQHVSTMLGQVMAAAEKSPEVIVLGVHLIKFAIAGFRAGTELEGYIDGQLDKFARQAIEQEQNPQPPEPSPEEKKLEMEMQLEQQKMRLEVQKAQMELQHKERMAQLEFEIKQMELAMKQQESALNMQVKVQESQLGLEVKQHEAEMGLEQKQQAFDQQSQQKDAAFQQSQKQQAQAAKSNPTDKGAK